MRAVQSQVEQYRVVGWQPLAVADLLSAAGYVLTEDELRGVDHSSVFLGRLTPPELHYTAARD